MNKCIICGNICPRSPQGYRQRKTCSSHCHHLLITQRIKESGYTPPKRSKIPVHYCKTCGKEFYPGNNDSPRNPNLYCCRKCRRPKSGKQSPAWKGGRINCQGYIKIMNPTHPRADQSGYVCEHILIMEKHLGRHLTKGEKVHHVNANRSDNGLQNLQLLSAHCHIKCPFCGRKFNPPQGTFI